MVTVPVGPYCELARWTLDRIGIVYTEECHAPLLHRLATRRHGGGAVVPVLDVGESSLTDARQIVRAGYPLLAAIVKRSLKLSSDDLPAYRATIDAALENVATRLADGRPHLCGERLSAADLAFATLLAPAVLPPEYRGPLPPIGELPTAMRGEVEEIRAHPAGQFALRLFREERGG